ncbi:von Willebrand factor type A domain-containing protein [Leucobacter luti]|nr:von Willebrand factor type A domain-containing protein [Leucobacter luti]
MGYSSVLSAQAREGSGRRAHRRRGTVFAAAATVAIALLGATPALAEQPTGAAEGTDAAAPAPEPAASVRWRAVDEAGTLQTGTSFAVSGPWDATAAATGQAPITAQVADNAGQSDYVGADLDPTPGAFELATLVDAAQPALTHELAAGDTLRIRVTATAAGEHPESVWQDVAVPASTDEAVPQIVVPVADPAPEVPPTETAPPEAPVIDDPPATEPTTTPAPRPAPSATPKAATDDASVTSDAVTPFSLGPDGPGVTAPYVYWTAVDGDGALVPGATFTIEGPRTSAISWTRTVTVTDCVSAPCTGIDRDPDPGEFQVKFLTPATNPTANGVTTSSRYRVTQTAAPSGYTFNSTANTIPGSGNTGNWGGTTYDFGAYVNTKIEPGKIVVKTGGDRTGASGVTNLAGVTLLLNGGSGSPNGVRPDGVSGAGAGWALCVSDANGECTFEVPNTQSGGANRDARFWVVQRTDGAPTGWFTNPSLSTGSSDAGTATAYNFRTGTLLRSGAVYRSTANFMYAPDSTDANASGGIWAQSRNNPATPQSCGIDVALVLDLSGSVGDSIGALRSASNAFVDALVGTQSRMSLFSFSTGSPALGASQNYPALTSVSTQAQADAFKARYSAWTSTGGTNWDRGLAATATAAQTNPYDVAVVITDGKPTFYGTGPSGPGDTTRLIETENGIFSANALKATGTRVLAFGVGTGATGANNALNLRAISGPTAGTDYFQTSNYATTGGILRNLALGNCASQLTVTKMVVPNTAPAGSIAGAQPAVGGWQFTASDPGPGITLPTPPTRVTENDGTGTVAFPLTFAGGTTSGPVTVTETQQAGYNLVPVSGQNAVCTNLVTGANVVPSGNPTNGVRVAVPNGQTVNCTIYNRAPDLSATVKVDKTWKIVDGEGAPLGTYHLPGDEGALPSGLTGQLTLSGPGNTTPTNQDWGAVRANYTATSAVSISETVAIDPAQLPGCTLTSNQLTKRGATPVTEALPAQATLTPGANTFEVTNTVTCVSQLTLLKLVEDGTASPANWDLTATGGSGVFSRTVSGSNARSAANTFAVNSAQSYTLSELPHDPAAPLAYLLDRVERCDPNPAAAGGCDWVHVDETTPVSVPIGQTAVYRFVNTPAQALDVPLTGGLSSDALGIAGAGIAGLALLVGAITWTRRRRTESSA